MGYSLLLCQGRSDANVICKSFEDRMINPCNVKARYVKVTSSRRDDMAAPRLRGIGGLSDDRQMSVLLLIPSRKSDTCVLSIRSRNSKHRLLCSESLSYASLLLGTLARFVHRGQTRLSRSHDANPILIKSTAVHGAIPALLHIVPAYHALQVRA